MALTLSANIVDLATSPDLLSWEVSKTPSLQPSEVYDRCAVYTGCFQPTSITGEADGSLTQIYTSVSRLPIHHTLSYNNGSETLSVTSSRDGGRTWKKSDKNPILPGPPDGLSVTGFRDPFISQWPLLAEGQKAPEKQLYGILSGGIKDSTPTAFVYSVDPTNLSSWIYIGLIADVGLNYSPSHWSGDFGRNWEVVNFASLKNGTSSKTQDFLIMGVEGAIPRPKKGMSSSKAHTTETRTSRLHLWMAGTVISSKGDPSAPLMDYEYGGYFDHGCLYASNSFWDPVTKRNIVFGWIQEEDHSKSLAESQGWQGVISLPRVLDLQTTHHVVRAHRSALQEITSIQCEDDGLGTYSVSTLGISPDPRVENLRSDAQHYAISKIPLQEAGDGLSRFSVKSMTWELECKIAVGQTSSRVGFNIDHISSKTAILDKLTRNNLAEEKSTPVRTVMFFDSANETFVIERKEASLVNSEINTAAEVAPHTLFTIADPDSGIQVEETLHVRVFWDMSVVEVFINGRTVISTRIYVANEGGATINFFADATGSEKADAVVTEATVWDGLKTSRS
ncbi:glycosyl hydrolase [Bisporella sp. PMI_857]|nr:glycosyl hydrolase [Bisporella sp. PMI_857]